MAIISAIKIFPKSVIFGGRNLIEKVPIMIEIDIIISEVPLVIGFILIYTPTFSFWDSRGTILF